MTLEEKINFIKSKWESNKIAIITDAKNNKYICSVEHNETSKYFALDINLHDINLNYKGHISIFRDPNNRLFLSSIYVYWDSRGLNLASKLNNLAFFVLRKESGKIIRGRFAPYSNPKDLNIPNDLSKEEQDYFAKRFYKSNGYQILTYEDYELNPDRFPELDIKDFKLGDETAKTIVFKKIPQLDFYPYLEENGVITEIEPEKTL